MSYAEQVYQLLEEYFVEIGLYDDYDEHRGLDHVVRNTAQLLEFCRTKRNEVKATEEEINAACRTAYATAYRQALTTHWVRWDDLAKMPLQDIVDRLSD
jgi:hypothetical protein